MSTLDGFAISFLLWLILYVATRYQLSFSFYEMDWGDHKGIFQAQYLLYRWIFSFPLVCGLGGGFVCLYLRWGFIGTLLCCSGIAAFMFLLLLAYFYESYLHARWKFAPQAGSNYSAHRYALILAFAISSIILFLLGGLGALLTCAG